MKLKEVAVEYESGRIAKEDYIKEMHEIHRVLFEYSEYIRGTDIKSIEITDDCVVITTKERGVKMYADVNDMRIIPIEILNFKVYEKEEQDMIGRMLEDISRCFRGEYYKHSQTNDGAILFAESGFFEEPA